MLNQDFKEFIQSLNDNGVRYLVVEGYAVALHGYPRDTKAMDVWVENSDENDSKVIKALDPFGFGSLDLKPAERTRKHLVVIRIWPIWKTWNDKASLKLGC